MTKEYKCPSCGGTVAFDSDTQSLKCPYCDSTFDIESVKEGERVLSEEKKRSDTISFSASHNEWNDDGLMHYICPSCGGEIITSGTLISTTCPYCSNNVILTDKVEGLLKPDIVIPFKKNKKEAEECFKKALMKKRYLSSVFKDEAHLDEIKGVYVPVWLFSSLTDAGVTYRAKKVITWSDSRYVYTRTEHYLLERKGTLSFEKIPVDGSSKISDEMMESLSPYDYSAAVDFDTAFLAGFLADKYDVTASDSRPRAIERAKSSVDKYMKKTTDGFIDVRKETERVDLKDGKCQYALLPVWLLSTKWEGKDYLFAVNGETGKFVGDLPYDRKRGRKDTALGTLVLSSLFFLLFYLAWAL